MASRIFFHVGAPKTGTTFLQGVMWHNRDVLRQQGMLYPGRSARDHLHASQVVRAAANNPRRRRRADAWDQVVEELAAWPGDGVISHEFFGMASRPQARAAVDRLAPAEVHVVLTARDFVRQFAADWQESLKMKLDLTLAEFLVRADQDRLPRPWGWNAHDIVKTLDHWGGAVTPDRVHVITVPPPGAPRDLLWRRWCSVLGLDPEPFDLDIAFGNQSLGVAQAELLRRLKPVLSRPFDNPAQRHRWVRGYFAHDVLLDQRGERFSLSPEQAEPLNERARAAVAAIEAAGYDVVGDLDELVPKPPAADARHPADVSETEVLEAALVAIERMLRDVRALTNQRNRWHQKASHRSGRRVARRLRRLIADRGRGSSA